MTTYYVSKTATNGYAVGVDSNNGTAKATPFLTCGKAFATAAAGDTVYINDGTYLSTDGANGSGTFSPKMITVLPENSGAVTLNATDSIAAVQNGTGGPGTLRIGAIKIDCRGTTQNALFLSNSATQYSVTLEGTQFLNFTRRALYVLATKVALTVTGGSATSITDGSNYYTVDANVLASGGADIDGLAITRTSLAGNAGVNLRATASGVTATVRNCVMNLSCGPSYTTATTGVLITNIANALVDSNVINITTTNVSQQAFAVVIYADATSPVQCDRPIVRDNSGTIDTRGGMIIQIGCDGYVANQSQRTNYPWVHGNNFVGSAASRASVHGYFVGWQKGGLVTGNTIRDVAYGLLDKGASGVLWCGNEVYSVGLNAFFFKGSAGGKMINNSYHSNGVACQRAVYAAADSPGTGNNSTGVFQNNIVYLDTAPSTTALTVAVGSSLTLNNNDWHAASGVTLPANPYVYTSTAYASFTTYKAGAETTALSVNPQFVNAANDLRLTSGSALRSAGRYAALTRDNSGVKYGRAPTIGAWRLTA